MTWSSWTAILPLLHGDDLCLRMREEGLTTRVLMLTATTELTMWLTVSEWAQTTTSPNVSISWS